MKLRWVDIAGCSGQRNISERRREDESDDARICRGEQAVEGTDGYD